MPIGALPVAMIQSPFFTLLMTAVRTTPLIQASLLTALRTAITMSAVAMRADVEDSVTMQPAAGPLPKVCAIVSHRRHSRRRGRQRQLGYVRLGPVLFWLTSLRFAAEWGTLTRQRQGSFVSTPPDTIHDVKMMGAFGAMMLWSPARSSGNYVFR